MIAGGIGVVLTLVLLVVLLFIIFIVSLFSIRVGAITFCSLFCFVLFQLFGPIAIYEARRMLNDGYHEREIDGVAYRFTFDEEDELELSSSHHPAGISKPMFATNVSGVGNVSFRLIGIDQPMDLITDCETIGVRYGLDEVDLNCAYPTRRYRAYKYVYESQATDNMPIRLACSDRFDNEDRVTQRCLGTFQIGRYKLLVWLSLVDPERWPEVHEHLGAILDQYFDVVPS